MQYVCDAPGGKTWFRIESEAEAAHESDMMHHAVEKHFRMAMSRATASYRPSSTVFIEQDIGLKAHVRQTMPWFMTLRDEQGVALATAMLPPRGCEDGGMTPIIVGSENCDPYPAHGDAIAALATHVGINLDRSRCYPYART